MNALLDPLRQVVSALTTLLFIPTSNMKAAVVLYAMIGVFLLIVLVVGVMIVMAGPKDEAADTVPPDSHEEVAEKPRAARSRMSGKARLLLGLGIVVVLASAWVVAGVTTSDSSVCKSCHWPAAQHAKADKAADPHAKVDCVSCHEADGALGRYVTDVPYRLLHLAMTTADAGNTADYGAATTRACASCHEKSLVGTTANAARGLKVSHVAPMAASARCIDCHTMRNGIVSVHNAGMKPCLRCHDDNKASSACATCHEANASAAARATTTSFRNAQIKEVSCAGCHNEKRDCDPCHGVRMPHTSAFKLGGHARAAAVDFWYNGGKACGRCHTASSHPCTQCHSSLIGKAHGGTSSMATSHQGGSSKGCDTCHGQYASIATRDFCKDVCHSPAAIAASPR